MPQTSDLQQSERTRGQKLESVPCIDIRQLGDPDADLVDTVRDACLDPGFFSSTIPLTVTAASGGSSIRWTRFSVLKMPTRESRQ